MLGCFEDTANGLGIVGRGGGRTPTAKSLREGCLEDSLKHGVCMCMGRQLTSAGAALVAAFLFYSV